MKLKRKQSFAKKFSLFFFLLMLFQMFEPGIAYALTSGPSQPEVQAFEPFGTSEMVDLFSGDFTYNIPLFELPGPNGGYPFNLAYHSGIGMDQEASWVGLGWSLNPGAINRNMRGLPDDFNGDTIKKTQHIKDNWTLGVKGGFNFEFAGADFDKIGLGIGLNLYYNSYKGVGLGTDFGISGMNPTAGYGLGLDISSDSQGGTTISPSLSLSDNQKLNTVNYNFGISLNSKQGLSDLTFSSSAEYDKYVSKHVGKKSAKTSFAAITFSQPQFTPDLSMPKWGFNTSFTVKFGADVLTADANAYVGGYFSIESLIDKGETKDIETYGYLYLEKDLEKQTGLIDASREKDGLISKKSPNLAIPSITHDAYSILGQGVGGAFRPYKSQVSTIYNRKLESHFGGGGFGLDIGVGQANKIGFDIALNYSHAFSHRWTEGEPKFKDEDDELAIDLRPNYFKMYGEQTFEDADYYSSESKFDIGGKDPIIGYRRTDEKRKGDGVRKPLNQVVNYFTNKQIKDKNNNVILSEFNTKYFNGTSFVPVDRENDSHIAGFTVLNSEGIRYNYTIPVYNTKQIDCVFSVTPKEGSIKANNELRCAINNFDAEDPLNTITTKGRKQSDLFLDKTELPTYSTSHLISSVLGSDYIDITGDGPSDDDFGYWVKFNYEKKANYNWRAPYNNFNYIEGTNYKISDDKASYMYGERETFLLKSVETKTHIAEFYTSPREDAMDVATENGSSSANNKGSKKSQQLNEIVLKAKNTSATGEVIKKVKFEYSYDLCNGVENSNINKGKLTLKKVWFEARNNNKGSLNPYYFDYGELDASGNIIANNPLNPDYNAFSYDRWGNYKDYGSSPTPEDYQFNYTEQDPNFINRDKYASAWCLRRINTPSGSDINVEYESDDYAYVQNKQAGQMFRIAGLGFSQDPPTVPYPNSNNVPGHDPFRLYEKGHPKLMDEDYYRRVYFNLETPTASPSILNRYFEGIKNPDGNYQMYYSLNINLRKRSEPVEERVTGYANIEPDSWGFDLTSIQTDGTYTKAYCVLEKTKIGKKERNQHPFALAAWQYLRTNLSDLSTVDPPIDDEPGTSDADKAVKLKQLLGVITSVKDIFADYYLSCQAKNWASHLAGDSPEDINNSWIRLGTPDNIKYGGGCRVKQVTINDHWNEGKESESIYGTVYEYKLIDGTSSGVAQYEPMLGGDENSLQLG